MLRGCVCILTLQVVGQLVVDGAITSLQRVVIEGELGVEGSFAVGGLLVL